ncbi:hypothetical protein EDD86DRAFT_188115 [Gorgonomyces haynaldii]|nr:hypothetical protein EDD86DRAFT_188115 [Gorgonomyces haynaldii]
MVCDFFYPNFGGVEGHIYSLSSRLIKRGHKVIVLTHNYKERVGIRYLTSGVKVYYLPHWLVTDQVSLPTVYASFPMFRSIFLSEQIDLVHGHQAFSSMCHEAVIHARTMGLKVVFTDHSLFGFQDTSSILTNKLLKFTLSDIDHVICVSHTSKENTVLRASLDPRDVSVIPNAIVAAEFKPKLPRDDSKITIVVASRLVYRKGIDLLVQVIPLLCQMDDRIHFLIAGDGPKRIELEQMREINRLESKVELLGAVPHGQIRDVLVKGHIFLNASLTEAFCIAIVEAVSCGCLVVSTKVGGVPEVLPEHMIVFSSTNAQDLVDAVMKAVGTIDARTFDPLDIHRQVSKMYSWDNVAKRTERVYIKVMRLPNVSLAERFSRYHGCGVIAGKFAVVIIAINHLLYLLLEVLIPRTSIQLAPQFQMTLFYQELTKIRKKLEKKDD